MLNNGVERVVGEFGKCYFKRLISIVRFYYTANKNDKAESKTGETKKPKTTGNKQNEKTQTETEVSET